MRRLAIKFAVVLAGLVGLLYLPYLMIGIWNRLFGGWRSVFFCYAGGAKYRDAYAVEPFASWVRWRPNPIGILRQGRGLGLVLASPVTEAEFRAPENAENFRVLRKRLKRVAWLMGVEQIHMAGVLPSLLKNETDLAVFNSKAITVDIVLQATEIVREKAFGRVPVPVILLGGAGFIGKDVTRSLIAQGRDVHVVDHAIGITELPRHLSGQPALLVDLAQPGALAAHLDRLWPGLVVLNEVFPEPNRRELAGYAKAGVDVWHIAGVAGNISPSLPGAYGGAVPCCATHDAEADLTPVLRQLTAVGVAAHTFEGTTPPHYPAPGSERDPDRRVLEPAKATA